MRNKHRELSSGGQRSKVIEDRRIMDAVDE